MRYITVVMGDKSPQSTNIATAVFDVLDVFLLDYDVTFEPTTKASQPSSNAGDQPVPTAASRTHVAARDRGLRQGESEEAARHRVADAFYWLRLNGEGPSHMRRAPSPRREVGHCWIGDTLGTYVAKHSEQSQRIETEVLIIAWRSHDQRQHFIHTPGRRGDTWETCFEQPLRHSGRLVSSERWSFTEHMYLGPRESIDHSLLKQKSWWSRLRTRVGLINR